MKPGAAHFAAFGLLALATVKLPSATASDNLPTVTPGNILRFELGAAEPPVPQARFGDQGLLVTSEHNRWVVLLGMDITAVPGSYLVAVNHPAMDTLHFRVRARRDPVVKRSSAEAHELETEALVETQLQRILLGMGKKPGGEAQLPLRRPVPARLVDRFGFRHLLPDGSYRPVRHVSFELAEDTAVRAPTSGKVSTVAETGRGRLVALDHGQGLVSVLWPLHETKARTGEAFQPGQAIGFNLVAAGTRSELNWALLLNRAWVHPMELVADPAPAKPPARDSKPAPAKKEPPERPPAAKPRS